MEDLMNSKINVEEKYFSLNEACKYLGISYPLGYKLVVLNRQIAYYNYKTKKNNCIRIPLRELRRYQEQSFVKAKGNNYEY